jgi:hypothetical protein
VAELFRPAFRTWLTEDATLAAMIDALDYGARLQGKGKPAVSLFITSDPRPLHFSGRQGLRQTRWQVDCFSDRFLSEAVNVADRIVEILGAPAVIGGVRFEMPTVSGPETSADREDALLVHRARLDVLAWHALV